MYRLVETRFAFLMNLLNILLNHWERLIGNAIESHARANRIAESMTQTNYDDLIDSSDKKRNNDVNSASQRTVFSLPPSSQFNRTRESYKQHVSTVLHFFFAVSYNIFAFRQWHSIDSNEIRVTPTN